MLAKHFTFITVFSLSLLTPLTHYADNTSSDMLFQSTPYAVNQTTRSSTVTNISPLVSTSSANTSILQLRLAISSPAEFTALFENNVEKTQAAINAIVAKANIVLMRDVGVQLVLIADNKTLIYTDTGSDPFTSNKSDFDAYKRELLYNSQANLAATGLLDEIDVAHTFVPGTGGIAMVKGACKTSVKGMGMSAYDEKIGLMRFATEVFAHELGHQLGATHSYNGINGYCGSEHTAHSQFEPGSGTTIMSYAGLCGKDNLKQASEPMYHAGNIQQIKKHLNQYSSQGCGFIQPLTHSQPYQISNQREYSIPARTPFTLNAHSQGVDADSLQASWEQIDSGTATRVDVDSGDNALFRSYLPKQGLMRHFPPMPEVISGSYLGDTVTGNTLPISQRSMQFSLRAHKNQAQTAFSSTKVHVVRTGSRFALNLPDAQYSIGYPETISWNVANTDKAPIHCSNVNIDLSVDGGHNFEYSIARNVKNTGQTTVIIPTHIPATELARFKLSCADNIFFNVSAKNFSLIRNSQRAANTHMPEADLADLPTTMIAAATPSESDSAYNSPSSTTGSNSGGSGGTLSFWLLALGCARRMMKK